MKTILKTLLFLLTVVLLSQCEKYDYNPQVNIPDDNFLNALIELGVDSNGDGIISPTGAKKITTLDVSRKNISDMTGIEAFVNLKTLKCTDNQLTSLDVSKNTALESLSCQRNGLTSLDVSKNTFLTHLDCGSNRLTRLDVSKNAFLTSLLCYLNQLTNLDVSNNTILTYLSCGGNGLTSLDVSKNTSLIYLFCGHNRLTSLDVSKNTKLVKMLLWSMPSLYKVCVWEMPFPPAGVEVKTANSPNVYFTTDCN